MDVDEVIENLSPILRYGILGDSFSLLSPFSLLKEIKSPFYQKELEIYNSQPIPKKYAWRSDEEVIRFNKEIRNQDAANEFQHNCGRILRPHHEVLPPILEKLYTLHSSYELKNSTIYIKNRTFSLNKLASKYYKIPENSIISIGSLKESYPNEQYYYNRIHIFLSYVFISRLQEI